MGRSQESYSKKQKEKRREEKKKEKQKRKEERQSESSSNFDDMIAYVDEYGNITDVPPDEQEREEVNAEDITLGIPPKEEEDPIRMGAVDFYDPEKGYGFIQDKDNNEKYFVHISDAYESIAENDNVQFEIGMGDRGPKAIRVKEVK